MVDTCARKLLPLLKWKHDITINEIVIRSSWCFHHILLLPLMFYHYDSMKFGGITQCQHCLPLDNPGRPLHHGRVRLCFGFCLTRPLPTADPSPCCGSLPAMLKMITQLMQNQTQHFFVHLLSKECVSRFIKRCIGNVAARNFNTVSPNGRVRAHAIGGPAPNTALSKAMQET